MRLTKLLRELPTITISGVHEVDSLTSLATQVSSMSSMLKNFTINGFNNNVVAQPQSQFENISCVYYGHG
ncbi:oligopeptide transporter 4-like [Gossypium australe]|uniref:Oligopeptide transporter 4-like n=1 Tax=Gossypium australe TaxID=47621 RepID=A0A5B6VVK0_9ROSI|nr:oligopeptide transporter 4-like [Gossypium australe]